MSHEKITEGVQSQFEKAAATGLIPPEIAIGGAVPSAPAPSADPKEVPAQDAPTAPASQPQDSPAEPKPTEQSQEQLLLGKYKDMDALEKGYYNMVNRASVVAQENERLRAQLSVAPPSQPWQQPQPQAPTVPGSLPGAEPRVNPAARDFSQERTVAKLAEELSVDPHVVADALQTVAGPTQPQLDANTVAQIVRDTFRQEFAPIQAQNEADAYMQQHHPEAFQHRQELEVFVRTAAPEIQRDIADLMNAGNQAGAYRLAWNAYQDSLQSTAQTQLQAQSQSAEAERLAARGAASMPSAPQGTPPHAVSDSPDTISAEQEQALLKRARAGDWNAQKEYTALKFLTPELKAELAKATAANSLT